MVYLGALNEGRGLEAVVQALVSLPEWELYLIGEGDLSALLRNLVDQSGLTDRVHFLGYMDFEEWKDLLPTYTLGLNLLESRSKSYYYSLANKFFDYIHAGLPCMQINFPEYAAMQQEFETSILIDALSASAVINAVKDLEQNPELYARLVKNCRAASRQWNWEMESKVLIDLFRLSFPDSTD